MIQDHIDSFIQARNEEGRPLPEYVLKEFDAFLNFPVLSESPTSSTDLPYFEETYVNFFKSPKSSARPGTFFAEYVLYMVVFYSQRYAINHQPFQLSHA